MSNDCLLFTVTTLVLFNCSWLDSLSSELMDVFIFIPSNFHPHGTVILLKLLFFFLKVNILDLFLSERPEASSMALLLYPFCSDFERQLTHEGQLYLWNDDKPILTSCFITAFSYLDYSLLKINAGFLCSSETVTSGTACSLQFVCF